MDVLRIWVGMVLLVLGATGCARSVQVPAGNRAAAEQRAAKPPQATAPQTSPDPDLAEATRAADQARERVKLGKLDDAEALYDRALGLREAALGPEHPEVAKTLNGLAGVYMRQIKFPRAEVLYERALAIQEKAFGHEHVDIARTLDDLAWLYAQWGKFPQAEATLERGLAIREKALGKEHPDVGKAIERMAIIDMGQGYTARAEGRFERALAIQEKALGKEHPRLSVTLHNLALLLQGERQYDRAEPLYRRMLAIREVAFGKEHPEVALALNDLASLAALRGDMAGAESLHRQELAIREKTQGPQHTEVARALLSLVNTYVQHGRYAEALPLCERALATFEAAYQGQPHTWVAQSLGHLGRIHEGLDRPEQAQPFFERSLAMSKALLGPQHPDVASALIELARLEIAKGQLGAAEPLYERALAIREQSLGPHHPDVADTLDELGRLRLARKRPVEALPLFERALALREARLHRETLAFSEARLSEFLDQLRASEERLYALARALPKDVHAQRLALAAALLLKGRSLEELALTSRTIHRGLGPEDRATFERLRALRTQLAGASLAGPGKQPPAEYLNELRGLTEQGDALENELARRSAPLRALHSLPAPEQIVERVAESLPSDGVLVELVAYADRPLLPGDETPSPQRPAAPGQERYLAFVLSQDSKPGEGRGTIRVADLGPAAPVDEAVRRLRDALSRQDRVWEPAARELYRRVFQPLVPLIGRSRQVYLATDGQLSLVPFAALPNGKRSLMDDFTLAFLDSGKQLLPRPEGMVPLQTVVVLADPDFEAAPPPASVPEAAARSAPLDPVVATLRAASVSRPWTSLPGTREEAQAIAHLLPEAQVLLGKEATKQALLRLSTPGVLHVASHGFFLDDEGGAAPQGTPGARMVGHFGATGEALIKRRPADPLLRSGLVLAGARAAVRREDALVTAFELSGLDLWGTQLVVLSACDTGRGEVRNGQGVYGLRRALAMAGAETVVMSLWKVEDEATGALMESYYRRLLAGAGRAQALREAMQALRAQKAHPHYWAPFLSVGLDGPLRGLAPAAPADLPLTPRPRGW